MKILTRLCLTLALLISALPATAQIDPNYFNKALATAVSVQGTVSADDTDVAFVIKYVGSAGTAATENGTVEVSSGDVLLKLGATGAEAADTTITGCGATAGTLDVDNAACNTLGELVDRINLSANWRAYILDGLRSRTTSGATLLTRAATSAAVPVIGVPIYWDTSVAFIQCAALVPQRNPDGYVTSSRTHPFITNPHADWISTVYLYRAVSTYGSGTSTQTVYGVTVANSAAGGSETVRTLWSTASGATTASQTLDFSHFGIRTNPGEKLLVCNVNSAAMASAQTFAYGIAYRK